MKIFGEKSKIVLRITNGNCSPPYSGGSGSAKHHSGFALCGVLLHHILPALVLLRKPLFGLAKRQLPRTLCDSFAQLNVFINFFRKVLDLNIRILHDISDQN